MASALFILNDNDAILDKLHDGTSFVNNATVTLTLKDKNGTTVVGVDGVALSYVAGSDGKYKATIASTVTLINKEIYTGIFTGTSPSGNFEMRKRAPAKVRFV